MATKGSQIINGTTYVYEDKVFWNAGKSRGEHKQNYIGKMVNDSIYFNAYAGPRDLKKALRKYIAYYDNEKPHQSLGYKSPKAYYRSDRLVKIQIA
ncbi:MAG: integrase core domain-containing protein [Spirochaetia bacterium]|jgi:transposase InsO family protein|nr:integrase core domain-containing protein [Spirochaetia bacterium]